MPTVGYLFILWKLPGAQTKQASGYAHEQEHAAHGWTGMHAWHACAQWAQGQQCDASAGQPWALFGHPLHCKKPLVTGSESLC
jgi:hypothetical protein